MTDNIILSFLNEVQLQRKFPEIEFAFAYGSGAVKQSGYQDDVNKSSAMLDMIFVVKNSEQWHRSNQAMNPDHYTCLFNFTSSTIANIQENFGGGLWYNALVPAEDPYDKDRLMKYGVISMDTLLRDLRDWKYLYVAGRLHKPVLILKNNSQIEFELTSNRLNALRIALLLLPETFSEIELYETIASLSYIGDPRMFISENPKKVSNLVLPVLPLYRSEYTPLLEPFLATNPTYDTRKYYLQQQHPSLPLPLTTRNTVTTSTTTRNNEMDNSNGNSSGSTTGSIRTFTQNIRSSARWELCQHLPSRLSSLLGISARERIREAGWQISSLAPRRPAIRTALSSIVARAAFSQTVKGLLTTGLLKTAQYSASKMSKRFPFLAGITTTGGGWMTRTTTTSSNSLTPESYFLSKQVPLR